MVNIDNILLILLMVVGVVRCKLINPTVEVQLPNSPHRNSIQIYGILNE